MFTVISKVCPKACISRLMLPDLRHKLNFSTFSVFFLHVEAILWNEERTSGGIDALGKLFNYL